MSKKNSKKYDYYIDDIQVPILPILTNEEEKALFEKYKNGDLTAKNIIINHNYGLVIKVCNQYSDYSISKEDLFQEGCLGLIKAIDKFDYIKGCKFSTYATWWIRQAISKYISKNLYDLNVSKDIYYLVSKINYYQGLLSIKLQRDVTLEDIANELNVDIDKIELALNLFEKSISLDECIGNDLCEDERNIYDVLSNNEKDVFDTVFDIKKREFILNIIDKACRNEKEKTVILERYGFNNEEIKTLNQIASEFNLTRERIRQIESKVLRRMRIIYGKDLKTL